MDYLQESRLLSKAIECTKNRKKPNSPLLILRRVSDTITALKTKKRKKTMLVSEFIKMLEKMKQMNGDLPVVVSQEDCFYPTIKDCAPDVYYEECGAMNSDNKIVECIKIF